MTNQGQESAEPVYLGDWAAVAADRDAVIIGDGEVVLSYAELDQRSNQAAHAWRELGLEVGDGVAILLENSETYLEVWWGGMRSGSYMTPVNWHLTPAELKYLLHDSSAKALVFHGHLGGIVAEAIVDLPDMITIAVGPASALPDAIDYETLIDRQPSTRLDPEVAGGIMFYSSGTTGQPKGIRPALSGGGPADGTSLMRYVADRYSVPEGARYLSTGPLYHSAPLTWSSSMHALGGTAVVMRRFDAEMTLKLIESQRITHVQFVPTMFQRIMNLPDEVRGRYDLSSLEAVWHAAAPCPTHLKQSMIDLFGPIIWEYYAGSEGGGTIISSEEWQQRPGSVGTHWTNGTIRIFDPVTLEPVPQGEEGLIYFEPLANHRFSYHNDAAKTDAAYHDGLFTLGDIGRLDVDGYLFLTDRKSNMIISGGVNIYPQEIEDVISAHPAVADVAVFGIPNEEFGEQVMAAITLREPDAATDVLRGSADRRNGIGDRRSLQCCDQVLRGRSRNRETPGRALSARPLKREIELHCRNDLAGYKVPRTIEFLAELPRDPNGKLYKRRLRDQYWQGRSSRII